MSYAVLGSVLGFGGPAGALLIRLLQGASVSQELRTYRFFYVYELVATCLVFTVAGFVAGRRADRLRSGRDRYQKMSELDSLTGLVNARTFRGHYERGVAHASRFHEPLSLLLLDVDHLKALNDELGHSFGSATLAHVGKILEHAKRAADIGARFGGDEFALLMPGAGANAARRQADTILERLRSEPVRVDAQQRVVSVTIGIATSLGEPREDLFEVADRALYAGKRAGRGRVEAADASSGARSAEHQRV